MAAKDTRDGVLPGGFETLEEQLLHVQSNVRLIDHQIRTMPENRGYNYELHPPGAVFHLPHPLSRQERIKILEEQKEAIQQNAKKLVSEYIKGERKEIAKEVSDKADMIIFPSLVEDAREQNVEGILRHEKDISKSQDAAQILRFDFLYPDIVDNSELRDDVDLERD